MDIAHLPIIQAKFFKPAAVGRKIRVIVIHDMEFPEKLTATEDVGHYFQHPDSPSSAHVGVDNDSAVRYVADHDVAYAAPGCNSDGLQMELAGYGKQNRGDWLDAYSYKMLALAAELAAQWCILYNIPPIHITNTELKDGVRGIIGHYQASAVYKKSDHTDPGPNFPWDFFISEVAVNYRTLKGGV